MSHDQSSSHRTSHFPSSFVVVHCEERADSGDFGAPPHPSWQPPAPPRWGQAQGRGGAARKQGRPPHTRRVVVARPGMPHGTVGFPAAASGSFWVRLTRPSSTPDQSTIPIAPPLATISPTAEAGADAPCGAPVVLLLICLPLHAPTKLTQGLSPMQRPLLMAGLAAWWGTYTRAGTALGTTHHEVGSSWPGCHDKRVRGQAGIVQLCVGHVPAPVLAHCHWCR